MNICEHYQQALSISAIEAEVDRLFPQGVTPNDLAPIDQLHIGGRTATRQLLQGAAINSAMQVLDIGCGTGGSSRYLAEQFGCTVLGIDLTARFCQLAQRLSHRLITPLPVQFVQGDALQLPLPDQSVDLILSQHCLMNLPELSHGLTECRRVLKPAGALLLHELVMGNHKPLHFPLPWASEAAQSHLLDETALQQRLTTAGLRISYWNDITDQALNWRVRHGRQEQRQQTGPLSAAMIYGERFNTLASNLQRCLLEGSVRVVHAQLNCA